MNNTTQLKQQFQLIAKSENQYPVDFDDAWQWVGYSTKQKGLNMLTSNFEKEIDFLTSRLKSTGGRPLEGYFLTVDCFKSFCMMAGTEKGKEVRKYYLAVEKELLNIVQSKTTEIPVTDDWKKNFPYPFILLEDAAVKMREMRLAVDKGIATPQEWRRVVLGDFSFGKPDTDESVINFVQKNLIITGNPAHFVPVADVYTRYEGENKDGYSRNKLIRKIKNSYPGIDYKQKKIDGYPVLAFFGCQLKSKKTLLQNT